MGWQKPLAVAGVVLAVILVAGGIATYAMSRPAEFVPYQDDVDATAREQQTGIELALRIAGPDSALAVIHDGTAYAMYTVPANATTTPDDWQRTVLAAMAPFAPETTTLVATQLVDGVAALEWRVPTEKLLAYEAGTLSAIDLEAAVTKTSL